MEFRKAHKEEIAQVFANVHEIWPHHKDLKTHINLRLKSPQHQHANWYVAVDGKTVAASLGAYPYEFCLDSEPVKGIAIGAVHTLLTYRRQGLAGSLMRHVHQSEREKGSRVSLLFSDIDPNYYKKMGYEIIPYKHGSLKAKKHPDISCQELSEHEFPFPETESDCPQVYRSQGHWQWLKCRHQNLHYLKCIKDQSVAYIICGSYEGKFYALNYSRINRDLGPFLESCAYFCQESAIHYWTPNSSDNLPAHNPDSEIPMILPLDSNLEIPQTWNLQAIDHV